MGNLIIITTPDLAPGFELAGAEVLAVTKIDEVEAKLRDLLEKEETSLIAIKRGLLEALPSRLRRQINTTYRPAVMAIPGSGHTESDDAHQRYIAEMIRRAIGYQLTFGTRRPGGTDP